MRASLAVLSLFLLSPLQAIIGLPADAVLVLVLAYAPVTVYEHIHSAQQYPSSLLCLYRMHFARASWHTSESDSFSVVILDRA